MVEKWNDNMTNDKHHKQIKTYLQCDCPIGNRCAYKGSSVFGCGVEPTKYGFRFEDGFKIPKEPKECLHHNQLEHIGLIYPD
jgi:hypothetical protein